MWSRPGAGTSTQPGDLENTPQDGKQHTHTHMHSSSQISQVCTAAWLRLLPARGWDKELRACRFGNDFNMVSFTLFDYIRPGLNCFCIPFREMQQKGIKKKNQNKDRVWTPNSWYHHTLENKFKELFVTAVWCIGCWNSWMHVRDLWEMLVSSPERDTEFFPSDKSNWTVIFFRYNRAELTSALWNMHGRITRESSCLSRKKFWWHLK